jgi:transcriptional regulator GlxA family with amidase domain
VPGIEIVIVGLDGRPVRDSRTHWQITPEADINAFSEPSILLIPGGPGVHRLRSDQRLLRWIRERHETSPWTASVCTGALLLAEAGLLAGRHATTHRASRDELSRLGVRVLDERVVRDGKILTSAGVSAGIELGLVLAAALRGPGIAGDIQRRIEYEPGPAFRLEIPDHAEARKEANHG